MLKNGKIALMRMGHSSYRGSIRYWALIFSLALHTAALGVFTGIKLSNASEKATAASKASLSVRQIEKRAQKAKPVPKVEPIVKQQEPKTAEPPLIAQVQPEPVLKKETVAAVQERIEETDSVQSQTFEMFEPSGEVEFFGQKSQVQNVCYVVDCSGSMYGRMYLVKEQLKKSILNLSSQHAFCIMFFMNGQKLMMSGAGLQVADISSKSQALNLIAAVRPAGMTDAAHALEMSMRLEGPDGEGPQVIYFLTDGFDLDKAGADSFVVQTERNRMKLAPQAVIHTIGFSPERQDRKMLESLAANSGGEFIEIN